MTQQRGAYKNTIDSLLTRVNRSGECWEWSGGTNGVGYGVVHFHGGARYLHRLMYETYHGPIPDGLVLDHLCRNRICCNPDHLEAVTNAENLRRGVGPDVTRRRHLARTTCHKGHPITPENIYTNPQGLRTCKPCRAEYQRAWRARRRAAA